MIFLWGTSNHLQLSQSRQRSGREFVGADKVVTSRVVTCTDKVVTSDKVDCYTNGVSETKAAGTGVVI
jgi:hypothetical protein